MNAKQIIVLSILYIATGVAAAWIVYKLGWNGGSGGQSVPGPVTGIPSSPAGMRPTGGYIPGRVADQVSFN